MAARMRICFVWLSCMSVRRRRMTEIDFQVCTEEEEAEASWRKSPTEETMVTKASKRFVGSLANFHTAPAL
eukprot:588756-Hanusia_phi.AAC.2